MLPPIIYLSCHDAGRLVSPYGYPMPTPCLQRFSRESILFRQAHCVAPTCSPSRAALLTGRYPHQVGMLGLAHRGFALNDYEEHLARRLKALGYATALAGVQHVASEPGMIGYDEVLPIRPNTHLLRDADIASAAARYIENAPAGPFYLECGFFHPHRPFPPVCGTEGVPFVPPYLPETPEVVADMLAYQEGVRLADAAFGTVLDALRYSGLWDRAIIILTTDHGPAFPFAKCNLKEQGTGVMLMVRLPGQPTPAVIDAPVSHLDLLPTLMDLLGRPGDPRFEGRSLLPLLSDPQAFAGRELFSSVTYHAAYEPMRSIRTGRHRYVRHFDPQWQRAVLPNIDDGPSKSQLCSGPFAQSPIPTQELYDLYLDPTCACNRIADPAYAATAQALSARLEDWMTTTDDPLLDGPVPLPPGAMLIPQDAYSPFSPKPPLQKPPAIASRNGAFTLMELLAVIAVIGLLAALLLPSIPGVLDARRLEGAGEQLTQWLRHARQEALTTNRDMEVRFYELSDPGAAAAPRRIRALQAFQITPEGTTQPSGPVFMLPQGVEIAPNPSETTLLALPELPPADDAPALPPPIERDYRYRRIAFHRSGTPEPPGRTLLTLRGEHSRAPGWTIAIDGATGRVEAFAP